MRKILLFFISMMITSVNAKNINILQNRLHKHHSFCAEFDQIVTNSDNIIVQQSKGKIWVKYPNLLKVHIISPDVNILISDGTTLWCYNQLMEQVTANFLTDITNNTLFFLIHGDNNNNSSQWKKYNIEQTNNKFVLVPKSPNSQYKYIAITITIDGQIKSVSVLEKSGLCNNYQFHKQQNIPISTTIFQFKLPSGVILDDQR